jgi:hypothetical protein
MLPDAPALVAGPAGAVWLDRDGEIHGLASALGLPVPHDHEAEAIALGVSPIAASTSLDWRSPGRTHHFCHFPRATRQCYPAEDKNNISERTHHDDFRHRTRFLRSL